MHNLGGTSQLFCCGADVSLNCKLLRRPYKAVMFFGIEIIAKLLYSDFRFFKTSDNFE